MILRINNESLCREIKALYIQRAIYLTKMKPAPAVKKSCLPHPQSLNLRVQTHSFE